LTPPAAEYSKYAENPIKRDAIKYYNKGCCDIFKSS